jgi:hypothetical protein
MVLAAGGGSMRAWITFEVVLTAMLLALNLFVGWTTSEYAEETAIARQTPAPEGTTYLDTCDGRPTRELGSAEGECLADYPGEFARGVFFGASLLLFLVMNILFLAWRTLRARTRPDAQGRTA